MNNIELFSYYFIKLSIQSDLTRFKLAAFWLFLEPILYLFLYFLLLEGRILDHEKTLTEFCIEITAWLFFLKNFTQNANVFRSSKKFISALDIRVDTIFILQFASSSIKNIFYLLVFVFIALNSNINFNGVASVAVSFIGLILLAFCFSLIFSLILLYIQDFAKIIPVVVLGLLFTSGIFFQAPFEHTIIGIFFEYNPIRVFVSNIYLPSFNIEHPIFLMIFILTAISMIAIFIMTKTQANIRNRVVMEI